MYFGGLGLRVIASFDGHDGFDGVILGLDGAAYHFEFTYSRRHPIFPTPTIEDLVVFYVPSEEATGIPTRAAGFTQVNRHQCRSFKVGRHTYWGQAMGEGSICSTGRPWTAA
jgi:hypothetical protein